MNVLRNTLLAFFLALSIGIRAADARQEDAQAAETPQVSAYFGRSVFAERRKALAAKVGDGVILILGAKEPEAFVPFRQNNTFFYFTGLEIPGAILWIDGKTGRSILFLPQLDLFDFIAAGSKRDPYAEMIAATGADNATGRKWLYTSLASRLPNQTIYTMATPEELGEVSRDGSVKALSDQFNDPWDQRPSREMQFMNRIRQWFPAVPIRDLTSAVDEMRWVKDAEEVRALRECARIGVEGMEQSIRTTRPGIYEHELADVAHYVFARRGASDAYFPIVASASNSLETHYNANNRKIEPNDLIVMDYAPEYEYEATDITRTWPASGAFSPEQAKYYETILEAHRAMIAAIRPGTTVKELKAIARAIYDKHGVGQYFPEGVGHFVGMSVHDQGPYDRPFVAGVVFNVEPMLSVPEKGWHFRLEDTVLVTPTGHEVLTATLPWELREIYELRDAGTTLQLLPKSILDR